MRNINFLIITLFLGVLLTGCNDKRGDSKQEQPKIDETIEPDDFLTFVNNPSEINSAAYAKKYYKTVDPNDDRTTLENWKDCTNFGISKAVHATFRDTKDLGYGRDMYAWQDQGNTYVYVDNYVVELEPGDATSYGPLNLDAAIAQDRNYHIGTNAIEFSPDPSDPDCKIDIETAGTNCNVDPIEPNCNRIAKFYIFGPRDASGIQKRLTSADLDGRGIKHMPTMCVTCHGATMYPLSASGKFNPISLKSPKLHMLEQHTFQFSPLSGYTKAEQENNIKEINRMVYETHREAGLRRDNVDDLANWDSNFAETLIEHAYGDKNPGDGILEQNTNYSAERVPDGWNTNQEEAKLFRKVVAPHCIGCHSLRGTQIAESGPFTTSNLPNSTNFSSYAKFTSNPELIKEHVYRRDTMPRSLINYSQFWEDPDKLPTLLASHIENFDVFKNGEITPPGRAVALPGTDRTVKSPVVLDATASKFTTSYSWQIASSTDPMATLDDPSSPTPILTAMDEAMVKLKLVTSNENGKSQPQSTTITIDNSITPSQSKLTFVNDIMNNSGILSTCISCHTTSSNNLPVTFNKDDYIGNEKNLYRNVLDRINIEDPENSLLVRKALSDVNHGAGFAIYDDDDEDFNTLINWIRNGAPCGNDKTYCAQSN